MTKPNYLFDPNIKTLHGFFGRKGGVSSSLYNSLNCNIRSGDNKDNVIKNREIALKALDLNNKNLCILEQVHSNKVITIKSTTDLINDQTQADSIVTNKKNLVLAVLSADCCPVLFFDPENQVIGAAHAGWKGALSGIIQNTITAMVKIGAELPNIKVLIGPCIGVESYEVGQEFYDNFINTNQNHQQFFDISKAKPHFNLRLFVEKQLIGIEYSNIEHFAYDTCVNDADFFSYRRSCKNKEAAYGCQMSVISLSS